MAEPIKQVKQEAKNVKKSEDIKHIRQDIDSLKDNVVSLTKTVTEGLASTASQQWSTAKTTGEKTYDKACNTVRQNPGRSVATAFAAGMIVSALIKSRNS